MLLMPSEDDDVKSKPARWHILTQQIWKESVSTTIFVSEIGHISEFSLEQITYSLKYRCSHFYVILMTILMKTRR